MTTEMETDSPSHLQHKCMVALLAAQWQKRMLAHRGWVSGGLRATARATETPHTHLPLGWAQSLAAAGRGPAHHPAALWTAGCGPTAAEAAAGCCCCRRPGLGGSAAAEAAGAAPWMRGSCARRAAARSCGPTALAAAVGAVRAHPGLAAAGGRRLVGAAVRPPAGSWGRAGGSAAPGQAPLEGRPPRPRARVRDVGRRGKTPQTQIPPS